MKLRPILFSTPMVLALLAGTKTQTRRLVKPQPIDDTENSGFVFSGDHEHAYRNDMHHVPWQERFVELCKYQVGDVLWVRETYRKYCVTDPETGELDDDHTITEFKAGDWEMISMVDGDGFQMFNKDGSERFIPWKSSMYMPFDICRLFLEIVSIRVERLQDIDERDANAEGISIRNGNFLNYSTGEHDLMDTSYAIINGKKVDASVQSYMSLWEQINGAGSWAENPYVWVYEFKRVDKPTAV